jgi:hypothetical protein
VGKRTGIRAKNITQRREERKDAKKSKRGKERKSKTQRHGEAETQRKAQGISTRYALTFYFQLFTFSLLLDSCGIL